MQRPSRPGRGTATVTASSRAALAPQLRRPRTLQSPHEPRLPSDGSSARCCALLPVGLPGTMRLQCLHWPIRGSVTRVQASASGSGSGSPRAAFELGAPIGRFLLQPAADESGAGGYWTQLGPASGSFG